MAVQKNFVIRNGLEVNNNLLVADSSKDYVGIGTSSPNYTLEVIGGIGVTYANILGIATVGQEFNVGTGGTVITSLDTGLTGFGTAIPAYVVDIRSPVSTGQTALYVQGDVRVTGDLYADDISFDQATLNNLEVTGVGTIATASIDLGYVNTGIVTNLITSGIGTIETASINLGYVNTGIVTNLITSGIGSITVAAIRDGYINTGIVTNLVTTGIASVAVGVITDAYVTTGVATNFSVSGIGSITTAAIDTGYINTGIVTNLVTTGIASIAVGVVTDAYVTTGIVTNLVTSGIGSITTAAIDTGYITTGVVTTITGTTLDYSGIGTIADLYATNINVSGVTTTGELSVNDVFNVYAPNATFHNDLIIDGNVTIGGTSAILNAVQVRVEDKDIILGFTTAIPPSDDTANHGGLAIASTEGSPLVSLAAVGINTLPDTYKQIMWVKKDTMGAGTTDAFLFNYAVGVGSTQVPDGVRLAVGSIHFTDNEIDTTNITVTGVTTSNSYNVGGTQVISAARELQNIASLDATTTATIEAAIANAPNTFQDIEVTGIATVNVGVFTSLYSPTGIITTLSGANIDYSGIGSFGTISVDLAYVNTGVVTNLTSGIGTFTTAVVDTGYITTGVVTTLTGTTLEYSGLSTIANFSITPIGSGATVGNSGIVTYYGDGSQLSNIISGVGIQSAGSLIGTGFTTLNFIGAGNTFAINGTTIDISIQGGGGAGAGGTWSTYNAGIATSKSVGINTTTLDEPNLTGAGSSFKGLYVGNGMIIVDNTLEGDHYIGTSYNGLMAGPVTVNGTLTVDGNYVVV